MNNIFRWIGNNILFLCTLALLIIIPLYPKLPLLDIQHTWVYIRVEDFVVAFVLLIFIASLLLKRVTLKTPLTFPILVFWIIGGLATLHGVFFIFSTLEGVHANVAFLSYLRRIEYMSLFFVAYASIQNKKSIYPVIIVVTGVLLLVVAYGMGQRFLGFPAYLTMNEEFAKGIPIQLTALSRISSTFAGHYDLAAYLVLVIPILASLFFGFKNIFIKCILLISSLLGFILLFMTISRVSFIVLLVSLGIVLMFQKKRLVIVSLVVVLGMLLAFSQPLLQRFGSTVSEVDVLVEAQTGVAIGPIKEVENTHFKDTLVTIKNHNQSEESATASAILPYSHIPQNTVLVVEPNRAEGENLSQGTSYINLSLSPVTKKVPLYFTEKTNTASKEAEVYLGEFVIKKAKAYDLSATTRFQGEWPRTLEAFKKNVFLGSGYGAVSLAVDNNYLRILGESGLLGLLSFFSIFIFAGIYIRKTLPSIESPVVRTFVLGFVAGSIGLALNAVLIDVFEASKIAFTYWLLMGITLGILHVYTKENINLLSSFKRVITSGYAITIYLLTAAFGLFFSIYNNYFVSMDYTWLRLASACSTRNIENSIQDCPLTFQTVLNFFSQPTPDFYRPATILYFYFMHMGFWLNQTMYHVVSLILYFLIAVILFLFLKQVFRSTVLPVISTGLFLLLAANAETVIWISSIDILFAALFAMMSMLLFAYWEEKKKPILLLVSLLCAVIAPFFHELGLVVPVLMIFYDLILGRNIILQKNQRKYILFFLLPFVAYGAAYFNTSGMIKNDGYDVLMAPVNVIGYMLVGILGPWGFSLYQLVQRIIGTNTFILLFLFVLVGSFIAIFYYVVSKYLPKEERRVVIFGSGFFLLAILPFIAIQPLQPQNGYVANIGIVILLAYVMKNSYEYLKKTQDSFIAMSSLIILFLIFSMMQIFQIQGLEYNAREISKKSEQFLISFSDHYVDQWKEGRWNFYFINVPAAPGQPWEKPSSLVDAIWFVTQNSKTNIILENNLRKALDIADTDPQVRVFEFQPDGSVKKVVRKTIKGKTTILKE